MKASMFIVGFLFPFMLSSQVITGKVTNNKKEALVGASVYWLNSSVGVTTGKDGDFVILLNENSSKKLIASYLGYSSDTVEISTQKNLVFMLKEIKSLKELTVTGEKEGIILSNLSPMKVETITQTELKKSACCDLAGCFETQSTVQPQTTNVITNSKELRILGLSGVYNQVLVDGLPMIQGLTYTYGISGIPGTLVDNIFISKGANSVLQGYESISGQINVETKSPSTTDKLLLNIYINSFFEKHFNVNYTFKTGKWNNIFAFQNVRPANKTDKDKDNFLDLPLLTRYVIYSKWNYSKESDWGWFSKIGFKYMDEERIGGQYFFNAETDKGNTSIYGQTVNIKQPELYTKTAYRINDKHRIVFLGASYFQQQNSYFGTVKYIAQQSSFYGNLQYELAYTEKHSLKTGISYRDMNLTETISFNDSTLQRTYDGTYKRLEHIPGIFAENSMSFIHDKLTWISGFRLDNHNQFGSTLTPRTLIKYDISSKTIIRANIGKGWRTVNLFSENIGLLVSSRDIIFAENLVPERALNYGLNMVHKFEINSHSGFFTADFYRTDFQNQIFPDYDSDATKAIIKNNKGTSISNGFQAEISIKIAKRIDIKTGYNYLDVYRMEDGKKIQLPFNPKHKLLYTLSFKPLDKKYNIDVNVHWFGEQRLPDTMQNPVEFQRSGFSKPYTLINAQFTYNLKRFEIYGGCENIFNFRQSQPIISWQNPYSPYFDTSSVWGPTRGRELYLGLRFRISRN